MLIACATVLGSFGCRSGACCGCSACSRTPEQLRFAQPYLGVRLDRRGRFASRVSLLLDPLSAVMILVVTGVGSLIHIYSLGYMAHDEERVRYFSYLNLFMFFMLLLVLGGNLPLMFVGWEGVGLCSYLLIGFWFKKKSATDAGQEGVHREPHRRRRPDPRHDPDVPRVRHARPRGHRDQRRRAAAEALGAVRALITIVCLLLFVGACGKSAQIPLYVWLPDAMEGPTPVSRADPRRDHGHGRRLHGRAAGPALRARRRRRWPWWRSSARATALIAATIALVQTDIKKVLAYSTVSQLGYMFLACGVGAFGVAVFHLFTHAFFKALLFLGSGSVIHALVGRAGHAARWAGCARGSR